MIPRTIGIFEAWDRARERRPRLDDAMSKQHRCRIRRHYGLSPERIAELERVPVQFVREALDVGLCRAVGEDGTVRGQGNRPDQGRKA
jgi:hypothetical protein